MTLWLTSDTHFGHAAVIGMCGRPFHDIDVMNNFLIDRWNAIVRPRDVVWHLGDFAMGPKGTANRFFSRLNGSVHLVRGNHDGIDVVKGCGWASVHLLASQRVAGVKMTLCHYPLLSWPGSSYNKNGRVATIMVHGHVHGTPIDAKVPHLDPCRVDVGVDMQGYAPVAAEEVIATAKSRVSLGTGEYGMYGKGMPDQP